MNVKVSELIGAVGSNQADDPLVSDAAAFPISVMAWAFQTGTSVASPVQDGLPTTPGAQ